MTRTAFRFLAIFVYAAVGFAQDPVIDAARRAATAFAKSLPDYVVRRTTQRYRSSPVLGSSRGAETGCISVPNARGPNNCPPAQAPVAQPAEAWRLLDTVTADVVAQGGKEVYLDLLVDGWPTQDPGKNGWWSEGEFSNTLEVILSPNSGGLFSEPRTTTIANRAAIRYDYAVEQPNSSWHISADASGYAPAHGGTIWIDSATSGVLRTEMAARELPEKFPLKSVNSTVEYGFVKIGEWSYLLPTHAETIICPRDSALCSRNVTEFRNYRKYSSESSVRFEGTVK